MKVDQIGSLHCSVQFWDWTGIFTVSNSFLRKVKPHFFYSAFTLSSICNVFFGGECSRISDGQYRSDLSH